VEVHLLPRRLLAVTGNTAGVGKLPEMLGNSKNYYSELTRHNVMIPSPKRAEAEAMRIVKALTLDEKFQLLTSPGFRRMYSTKPIKRVGIPSFKMTDGPLGVAMHSAGFRKCTRFPSAVSLAATWDRSLAHAEGAAVAEEVRAAGRNMILAPGINICRTPLGGRTFEYYSEDPFLTKEMAIPFVQGVQEQGVAACIKHFAVNNQEIDRRSISSELNERTLHEIYLRAFESVVKEAGPWSVMAAYNKVNGIYCCENRHLLRETLMDNWGFEGFVVSDWFATRPIETTAGCINAGLSLEMPIPSKYKHKSLEASRKAGDFTGDVLDDLVYRLLRVMYLSGAFSNQETQHSGSLNTQEHTNLARIVAERGTVLLKNTDGLLPLHIGKLGKMAVVGPNLKKRFGKFLSGGSSAAVPPYEITPLQGLREKLNGKVELTSKVERADVAVVFVGLNHKKGNDSEASDRKRLELPSSQVELIHNTIELNPQTIVVVIAGSPIGMQEWIEEVPSVVLPWYSGMEGGRAIANILFGDAYPSGRLPLTFPKQLRDSPAHTAGSPSTYPGDAQKRVFYDEGIFVGYRWFDQRNIEPLFPFGYGLGYTEFVFDEISVNSESLSGPTDIATINVKVENVGDNQGSETIQVYAHAEDPSIERPPRELVGFAKLSLKPHERGNALINVKAADLAYYRVEEQDWHIDEGGYQLHVGKSSRNILGRIEIQVS
jgi:beta-glucosidase